MDIIRSLVRWFTALFDRSPYSSPQPTVTVPPAGPEMPLNAPTASVSPTKAQLLYDAAKLVIGTDLTPRDEVPDRVACVVQLQAVFHNAFGHFIGTGAARYNTKALDAALAASPLFRKVHVRDVKPGCIAVAPTGHGTNPSEHGHCWITGKTHWMSNDSRTGRWEANYTYDQVHSFFVLKRGFPLNIYEPIP